MNPGTYAVKCLYGSSSSSVASMTPAACTKNIIVKAQNDASTQ